jgi:transketolase
MALAERNLAATFNRPGFEIVDHRTWVFVGDGCLMEGISHEVCSLAGTLGLGRLTAFYDDNGISIDGEVRGWFTDDTPKRFEAYGWHVIPGVDGHDAEAVRRAIDAALAETARPSLICCKTIIGWGAPNKQGTEATHGAALGEAEVAAARIELDWPYPPFEVPEDIRKAWNASESGRKAEAAWTSLLEEYGAAHPDLAAELQRRQRGELPRGWRAALDEFVAGAVAKPADVATRSSSQQVLNALAPVIPELFGGSADLTGSNNTNHKKSTVISRGQPRRQLSSLRRARVRHDGDHERDRAARRRDPLRRHLSGVLGLRTQRGAHGRADETGSDPGLHARFDRARRGRSDAPADRAPVESADHSQYAPLASMRHRRDRCCMGRRGRAARRTNEPGPHAAGAAGGEAGCRSARGDFARRVRALRAGRCSECVLIATGSEVGLALDAARELATRGRPARVVSMPCTSLFDAEPQSYRDSVLPPGVPRVAIEAGAREGWWRYVGSDGAVMGMTGFGASAPAKQLFPHFGFTRDHVIRTVEELLTRR